MINNNKNEFNITKKELNSIVNKYINREKDNDELNLLESNNGIKWIIEGLKTNIITGIDSKSVNLRNNYFKTEREEKINLKSYKKLIWIELENILLRILIISSLVIIILNYSLNLGSYSISLIDGVSIFLSVFFVSGVKAGINYINQKRFKYLKNELNKINKSFCIRDNELKEISNDDIVIGDLIKISKGMEVPADGFLVEGNSIKCSYSLSKKKQEISNKEVYKTCIKEKINYNKKNSMSFYDKNLISSPILLSGTKVLDGMGYMIIISIENNIKKDDVESYLEKNYEHSLLKKKLKNILLKIGYFGLIAEILIFIVKLIRIIIQFYLKNKIDTISKLVISIILDLIITIAILIVVIPESLPIVATIAILYSNNNMIKDNNLLKNLQGSEMLGKSNVLIVNKTGLLTKKEMVFSNFWSYEHLNLYNKSDIIIEITGYKTIFEFLYLSIFYNSDLDNNLRTNNKIDLALLEYFYKLKEKKKYIKPIYKSNFNRTKKFNSSVVEIDGKIYCFIKGAPEFFLNSCNKNLSIGNYNVIDLNQTKKNNLLKAVDDMGKKGLITIGVAFKIIDELPNFDKIDENGLLDFEKDNFIFLGICGIKNEYDTGNLNLIRNLTNSGIKTIMVTGDNKENSIKVAKDLKIIPTNDKKALVLSSSEFLSKVGKLICKICKNSENECNSYCNYHELIPLNDKNFLEIQKDLTVIYRSTPQDKLSLISCLKHCKNTVATTLKNSEDINSFENSDVKIGLNLDGDQLSKQNSDIIILDDSLRSIVNAVTWGRHINEYVGKCLQFQLSANVVVVIITIISSSFYNISIFNTIQILWFSIIIDSLAQLALSTEKIPSSILERKFNKNILTKKIIKHIIGQILFQLIVIWLFLFAGPYFLYANNKDQTRGNTRFIKIGDEITINDYTAQPSEHFTYCFNIFVILQLFNIINSRKINDEINVFKNIWKSKIFIIMLIIILGLQIIFVTFFGRIFGVIQFGLNITQWFICFCFGALSLIINTLLKCIPEEWPKKNINNKKKILNTMESEITIKNSK